MSQQEKEETRTAGKNCEINTKIIIQKKLQAKFKSKLGYRKSCRQTLRESKLGSRANTKT